MPPKRGRPPKTDVVPTSEEPSAATPSEDVKEIVCSAPAPVEEVHMDWRERIRREVIEEEYRSVVRSQIADGTLMADAADLRAMLEEIAVRRHARASVSAPPPVAVEVQWPQDRLEVVVPSTPVTVEVQWPETAPAAAPAADPKEWAEEFGVLLSTFLQTDKGVTLVDALERQTKIWARISSQLERLNGLVASLLDEEPLEEDCA